MNGRVGIDMVPFARVRDMVAGDVRLLHRLLSTAEIALSRKDAGLDIPGVAGRLAAKEAFFKLLRVPGETVPWRTTEVLRADGGWPEIRLTGRSAALAARAGIGEVSVSITHDDDYAMAAAFAVAGDPIEGGTP
jgi:holo-[acyl-carrier protein] synthase